MKCAHLILTCLILSSSSLGFASNLPITTAFYCQLHYSKLAYGKEVKRVFAHTGVETSCEQPLSDGKGQAFWDRIQDFDLKETASGFQGKFITYGSSSTYYPCSLRPVAQFWVEFSDGTSQIESPTLIQLDENLSRVTPVWHEGSPVVADAVKAFQAKELQTIDTVACFSAWSYGSIVVDYNSELLEGEGL